jgi:hypothetical protein
MTLHVHTHAVHHGAAESRKQNYLSFFESLCKLDKDIVDFSRMSLCLSDEDVRYTTDAAPGVYNKLACLEWACRLDPSKKIRFHLCDLYAAPGMDVVYCMLLCGMHLGISCHITGVSIVRGGEDSDRFKRMCENTASALKLLPVGVCEVDLRPTSALQFCKELSNETRIDILFISMPWMTSMGEMHGSSGTLRNPSDMASEAVELLEALNQSGERPLVVSLMVPYDHDSFAFPGYCLLESVLMRKRSGESGLEISSYYTHLFGITSAAEPVMKSFEYYV